MLGVGGIQGGKGCAQVVKVCLGLLRVVWTDWAV